MATADKLVLVRDAFACKPAVVAETDDYVAISSEFRSLAHLPGVKNAHIFEPVPEQIYSWTRVIAFDLARRSRCGELNQFLHHELPDRRVARARS